MGGCGCAHMYVICVCVCVCVCVRMCVCAREEFPYSFAKSLHVDIHGKTHEEMHGRTQSEHENLSILSPIVAQVDARNGETSKGDFSFVSEGNA